MARLFVALSLPADVEGELASLPRPNEKGVRWTRPDQWHVTLRFLGDCSLDDATIALGRLEARAPIITLGPRVEPLGRNVISVPVDGAAELAASVVAVTGSIGQPPDSRPFRGHITIARLSGRGASGLTGAPISSSFVADHIELIESTLTPDGPIYETRLEVPLLSSSSA